MDAANKAQALAARLIASHLLRIMAGAAAGRNISEC
jgi:hypothetical protein